MRFQFQSDPGQFSYKPALFTDAIKILVSVNFGIFLLQTIARTEGMFSLYLDLCQNWFGQNLCFGNPSHIYFSMGVFGMY